MIAVEGEATPEEIAAITAVISAMTSEGSAPPSRPRSPWKFANLHPELDIDTLRHAQGKPIVL